MRLTPAPLTKTALPADSISDQDAQGTVFVIQLTRLNNTHLAVNSDLVKFVETAPDTVITLITGEKVVVRESMSEVIRRIVEFRKSVLAGLPSAGANLELANCLCPPAEPKPEQEENASGGDRG